MNYWSFIAMKNKSQHTIMRQIAWFRSTRIPLWETPLAQLLKHSTNHKLNTLAFIKKWN